MIQHDEFVDGVAIRGVKTGATPWHPGALLCFPISRVTPVLCLLLKKNGLRDLI
jgi:hypothetical protein